MLTAADYRPPRWLRNPHLQSMLSSSRMRMQRGLMLLAATGAMTEELILDGGQGVRLQRAGSRSAWRCCCTAGKAVPSPATCA